MLTIRVLLSSLASLVHWEILIRLQVFLLLTPWPMSLATALGCDTTLSRVKRARRRGQSCQGRGAYEGKRFGRSAAVRK